MSLFVVLTAFFLWGIPLDFSAAARLRPFPRRFWIRFCAKSLTCFAMIWRGLTSLDVLSAKSDRFLPPVRIFSRPTTLTPLQAPVEPAETDCLKSCLFHVRVVRTVCPNKLGLHHYVSRDLPDGSSTAQEDLSLCLCAGAVCVDIYR